MRYTLVQHSAGHNGDPSFVRAVQVTAITREQERVVHRVTGLVFEDYTTASAAEYRVNYPEPERMGLIPRCRGGFSEHKVDGLAIYLPAPGERSAAAAA